MQEEEQMNELLNVRERLARKLFYPDWQFLTVDFSRIPQLNLEI